MARCFNTTGPCIPGKHYMLEPEKRCPEVGALIEGEQFFVIHAPRQSGKTTLLKSLTRSLQAAGKYHALYLTVETAQGVEPLKDGMSAILRRLALALEEHPTLSRHAPAIEPLLADPTSGLYRYFRDLSTRADKPLVVFIDEADCLGGETLISFLRQLRDGYVNRGEIRFIHALALVGMRNIRDFKVQVREDGHTLGSASPFNVSKTALTLSAFSREETGLLYRQHTQETGQAFPPEAMDHIQEMTQGQPWLANAIAAEMVEGMGQRDFTRPLSRAMAEEAIQRIILRRDTHIDSLLERLKEKRVQKVVEAMLLGQDGVVRRDSDDFHYTRDLGLIREQNGVIRPANPIYSEVIIRTLNRDAQADLPESLIRRWLSPAGIAMSDLLRAFQEFWRDHSDIWCDRFEYREAAPHLILLAFLQRVANGGARIHREFATGTRRLDICVEYAGQRYPIELKILYDAKTRPEGIAQLSAYLDSLGSREGWLVLFNRNAAVPWEQKLSWETIPSQGRTLHIVGA